ncbi:hypothetical protein SPO1650 [Ruegeria pomeroyi DSS-3]|uniref:Uncharacterized protein n=1 Tax=Ruegeria pomeroyi (strain ATCC 700808 / DSM 15171 / DSS-3) TaxID=246200 RepID=Q5LSW4_RUEPO|nr:hypothetical protein SPO1650 [Ruegeria pomeroyi DSS-3]
MTEPIREFETDLLVLGNGPPGSWRHSRRRGRGFAFG